MENSWEQRTKFWSALAVLAALFCAAIARWEPITMGAPPKPLPILLEWAAMCPSSDKIFSVKKSRPMQNDRRQNNGFTLLEILVAMTILAIGMTAVVQTTRSALRRMAMAKELTEAQNACHAVLNELLARSSPIQPEEEKTVEHLPHWKIRVDIYPASQPHLYVLHLSAQHFSPDGTLIGAKYQLLRWVPVERVHFPEPSPETSTGSEFDSLF